MLGILTSPDRDSGLSQHDVLAMRDCMASRGLAGSSLVYRQNFIFAARWRGSSLETNFEQPIFSANGRLALLYDGQFQQLDSLRDELARLGFPSKTSSTGEVLINAWTAWGRSCVRKLFGSFAIAVVDLSDQSCWLVRDRCGAKPLFYSKIGSDFVFASSIKSLQRHPRFSAVPNFAVVRHYLTTLRLTLDDQTLLENVRTVMPAETVRFHDNTLRRETYWTPDQPIAQLPNYRDSVEELNDQLSDSIARGLDTRPATSRVGLMLQPTVDSGLLGSMVADQLGQSLASCHGSFGSFKELDEAAPPSHCDVRTVNRLAREMKYDHRQIQVDRDEFQQSWQQLILETGTPLTAPREVLLHQVARSLRNQANWLLSAEGADEVFCGYNVPHWAGRDYENAQTFCGIQSLEAEQTRESLRRQYGRDQFYSPSDHFFLTSGLMPRNTISSIMRDAPWAMADEERGIERYYDRLFAEQGRRPMTEKWANVLFRVNLESLLSRLDRVSAQVGVQVSTPYTDHRLIEFAFRLPHHYKIDLVQAEKQPWLSSLELEQRQSIQSKRVLRSVAKKWISGDLATRSQPVLPAMVSQWLADDWQPWIERTLRESSFFNQTFQESTIDQLQSLPVELALWKWPLVNLALWGDQVF